MTHRRTTAGAPRRARRLRSLALLAALAAPLACGGDPVEPSLAAVAGAYTATAFTVTERGATTDLLAGGASLQLALAADRSVTGRLLIPDGDEGGGDLDAPMTGTWTLSGSVVRFEQSADTFVRDMPFTVSAAGLSGDATFGDARVRVTLQRTP